MPRYEFSEGTSNKFWEIKLTGKSFTTTYGKIGTSGQTTMKEWKDEATAKKEYDKLIAEKTKKGYAPADGGSEEPDDEDEDMEDEEEEKPVAKKVAKPAAKAAKAAPAPKVAAKPAAKSGGTAPRYFEFSEGTSNKFWEITMTGNAVKTRYGKIGTPGQQTLKEFGDKAAAQKEYDKLVHEKTKKGYEETDAPSGGGDDDDDE
jgi:predicted DNA-binding WGR domain protein